MFPAWPQLFGSQQNRWLKTIKTKPAIAIFWIPAALALALILIITNNRQETVKKYPLSVDSIQSSVLANTPAEIAHAHLLKSEATQANILREGKKSTWVLATINSFPDLESAVVEFRIFRPSYARFWIGSTINGELVYSEIPQEKIQLSKSGFAIFLEQKKNQHYLVGEYIAYMPSKIQASVWDTTSYSASILDFERRGGVLFGGILTLAAFCAILSIISKDLSFFLLSCWLIASLRVAAINGGWDAYWLAISHDSDSYLLFLRLSLAVYGLLTATIFKEIFVSRSQARKTYLSISFFQISFFILAVASLNSNHLRFLEVFWLLSGLSILVSSIHLLTIVLRSPFSAMSGYSIAWWGMIIGMLSEIAFQANITTSLFRFNSQSAALISAIIMCISLSHRFRDERRTRLEAQSKHLSNLKKFRNNYNAMPIGLFAMDSIGNIQHFNPAFGELFALKSKDFRKHSINICELLGDKAISLLHAIPKDTAKGDIEFSIQHESGLARWFLVRVSTTISAIEGSIQDITQKKNAELELRNLVDHDHLTGLLNRRGLESRLRAVLAEVGAGQHHSIAYLDIDRFKLVNDLHGFGVGDALLQQVARRLAGLSRGRDSLARVADSFVIVLNDCSAQAAVLALERVREAICGDPFDVDGKMLNVTVSVGVVALDSTSISYMDVMAAADRACSEAKARGRNCVVQLSDLDATLQLHLHELRVVANLQQKIPTDRYFLELQPIVSLSAPDSSLSYEVLIRMRDEDGSVVPPSRFIGAAERHGLMSQIDRWVLRNTLEWLDANPQHRDRINFATLNLSGASLNDRRFVDDAFAMIEEHRVSASKLCFEITESVALHDVGSTRRFADRIRQSGSMLALDDFGAGYTSFNYLKEIPADFIKIDGSFVKDINLNPANYAITRTIVDLTHELGMRSIAEWAETHDTVASLIDLRVDFAQGFGLVRPVCPDLVLGAHSCGSLMTDPKVIALLSAGTSKTGQTVL
jgi:diguanylate cyclase (GGDEF)-like protein/PAS domain S-box-containing protein